MWGTAVCSSHRLGTAASKGTFLSPPAPPLAHHRHHEAWETASAPTTTQRGPSDVLLRRRQLPGDHLARSVAGERIQEHDISGN